MKALGINCARRRCIALAESGRQYCAVHRDFAKISTLLDGEDAPDWSLGYLQPVTDRIESDADGKPVRFYPVTRG